MSLRWHVPLPGPFSVSGNAVPKGSGSVLGPGIAAFMILGGVMLVISFVITYWWQVLVAVATPFVGLFVIFFTIEEVKYRKARAAAKQSAEQDAEPHGAGPHMHGETH